MAKKLKELPHVIAIMNKYLDDREAKDLGSILEKNEEYRNLLTIHRKLSGVQKLMDNKDVNTGSLEINVDPQIKTVLNEIQNFSSREEFKKEKTSIENYTKTKKEIIESLMDEEVEQFVGVINAGYYSEKANIINIPNKDIGRLINVEIQVGSNKVSTGYSKKMNSLFLGNAILPTIEITTQTKVNGYMQYGKENLYVTCAGNFLYKDDVWNESCENFLHKKFSAKATVKNIVERSLKNKFITGSKPEWVCNMELMS